MLVRLDYLGRSNKIPEDLVETLARYIIIIFSLSHSIFSLYLLTSICFCSQYVSADSLPAVIKGIKQQFGEKFVQSCRCSAPQSVSPKLVLKFSTQPIAPEILVKEMEEIAKANSIPFDVEKVKQQLCPEPKDVFSSVQSTVSQYSHSTSAPAQSPPPSSFPSEQTYPPAQPFNSNQPYPPTQPFNTIQTYNTTQPYPPVQTYNTAQPYNPPPPQPPTVTYPPNAFHPSTPLSSPQYSPSSSLPSKEDTPQPEFQESPSLSPAYSPADSSTASAQSSSASVPAQLPKGAYTPSFMPLPGTYYSGGAVLNSSRTNTPHQ